jgi:hypothetical protein
MLLAAALLFFGATLQAGVGIGSLREPQVIPLAILEMICGLALLFSVWVLFGRHGWKIALVANAIAFIGIVVEIVIRAILAGPHTAPNHSRLFFPNGYVYTVGDDFYHASVLGLIVVSFLILAIKKSTLLRA